MRTALHCTLMLLLLAPAQLRAQVVDRMVAVVNKQVILQSELEQVTRVEFLLQGHSLGQLNEAEMQKVLDRMIDQDLLQQQIAQPVVADPTPEEMAAHLRDARSQIPGADTDDKWQAMLAAYGVTEHDVANQLLLQVKVLRFIDLRFRGLANIDKAAIDAYYQETLVQELRKQNAPVPPLNEVSGKIEQILMEQRIDELLNDWLQTLRAQAHIQKMNADGSPMGAEMFGGAPQSKASESTRRSGRLGTATGARQ